MKNSGWQSLRAHRSVPLSMAAATLLAIAATTDAAVTIAQPSLTPVSPPTRQPAVTAIVPISAAALPGTQVRALPRLSSDFETPDPAMAPLEKIGRTPILGNFSIIEIAGVGIVLIGLTAFARRRHRQLVGWGFMPDRSLRRTPPTP